MDDEHAQAAVLRSADRAGRTVQQGALPCSCLQDLDTRVRCPELRSCLQAVRPVFRFRFATNMKIVVGLFRGTNHLWAAITFSSIQSR